MRKHCRRLNDPGFIDTRDHGSLLNYRKEEKVLEWPASVDMEELVIAVCWVKVFTFHGILRHKINYKELCMLVRLTFCLLTYFLHGTKPLWAPWLFLWPLSIWLYPTSFSIIIGLSICVGSPPHILVISFLIYINFSILEVFLLRVVTVVHMLGTSQLPKFPFLFLSQDLVLLKALTTILNLKIFSSEELFHDMHGLHNVFCPGDFL